MPGEVSIKDWVVVSYGCTKKKNYENFIGKILKVKNGKFIGQFLRPATTREHSGFIFNFPAIKDIASFSFSQIKKRLPPPEKYGRRGLLRFTINGKMLRTL